MEGLNTNVHQKVITLLYQDSSFLSHTTSTSRETFIASYCAHHNFDTIPSPSIHPLTNTYTTAAQRDKEQLLHTKSLQLPENKGLQTFRKTVECIVTVPSVSFETQIDENNKEIVLKKLSTEIIMGKTKEDTAMELDAEGGASFDQLHDLIKKNVLNGIRNTALWNKNTTNYRTHSRIVLAMASSGAMVTTYSGMAQLKREVKRE